MHMVREIASLAYWKNWALELRLDKHGDALVMAAHFPKLQDRDFVINIFRENDPQFNPYPLMKEWLQFFRNIVKESIEAVQQGRDPFGVIRDPARNTLVTFDARMEEMAALA